MKPFAHALSMLLVPALACGGGGGADLDPDAAPAVDADPSLDQHALVVISETFRLADGFPDGFEEQRYATISAEFGDAPRPSPRTVAETSGPCTLTTYEPVACDPACGADALCVPGGTCAPLPTFASVGPLSVEGLTTALDPIEPFGSFYSPEQVLPEDLFADDATLTISAPGDELGSLEVSGHGVAPIEIATEDAQIELIDGQPYTVTWTPSTDADARVRVTINSNNTGHGTPFHAIIACEVDDAAGELTIPSSMIEALPAIQRWGGVGCPQADCPPSTVARVRRATSPFEGGVVALEVQTVHAFGVLHEVP